MEIFSYLNARDLLNLTLTCKKFHKIVEKSKSLCQKLTINFEKRLKHIGKRKYSNLQIYCIDTSFHFILLRFLGEDITKITFSLDEFMLDVLRRVLVACKNVKVLTFEHIKRIHGIKDVSEFPIQNFVKFPHFFLQCDTKNLPFYDNLNLTFIESDPRIFKILKNCTATKIFISCPEFALRHYFNDFLTFLKAQKTLTDLTFHEFIGPLVSIGIILFNSNILTQIDFKLRKLEMRTNELIPYGNSSSDVFFESFMDHHKETLETLTVDRMEDFDFTNYLKDCRNLKNLSIGDGVIASSKLLLPSVSYLEVEQPRMNFIRTTPNIKELRLSSRRGEQADLIKWYLLARCQFLEKLEVFDLPMDDFPIIPSLKSLKLDSILHIDSEVFSRNPQIEELSFVNCHELSRRNSKVLKIIVGYLRHLRKLSIVTECKIHPSAIKYVKAKCHMLKIFRIYRNYEMDVVEIY